jgi:transposase
MGEALILEGPADSTAFEISIEQILAPSLQAGQIVIMDNLSTHTGAKVRQALAAKECQLLFLPSYSPDLSPIEEAFSKRHPPFYVGWEPEHQTHCRRRLDKHFSRLPFKMPAAGLLIVATVQTHFCLPKWKDLRGEKTSR